MWDRYLLELLHLPRGKEHAEGQEVNQLLLLCP